jgi:signal peptidase I
MKLAKKIIKSIAYLLLGMLVTLCIYTFIMTDIMKEDYANVFGYTYFVVATGSMSGTIEVNDIVIVKLTNDVKLNDIITYKGQNDEFITHRLIKKQLLRSSLRVMSIMLKMILSLKKMLLVLLR